LKSRLTISIDQEGVLEIFLNEAARDRLIEELQRLNFNSDHFHLAVGELSEVELRGIPYRASDRIIDSAKVMLRPDDWDRRHFSHVLES
jgi:hypothetical protein